MNPADVRALIAIELKSQDIKVLSISTSNSILFRDAWLIFGAGQSGVPTWDQYLAQAQQILESSWKNYKHPAGEDNEEKTRQAVAYLVSQGYAVMPQEVAESLRSRATSSSPSTPQQPEAVSPPPSST